MDEREAFRMCRRKKKYKSGKAGRLAGLFKQRKYHCPVCGQWHLTTKGVR
jgi:rubrerythrin